MSPYAPKIIAVAAVSTLGVAYGADAVPPTQLDFVAEVWRTVQAAGILGCIIMGYLFRRQLTLNDNDRKELGRLQTERDAMHERSLTALISIDKTMQESSKVMLEMVKSNRDLLDWLKDKIRDLR